MDKVLSKDCVRVMFYMMKDCLKKLEEDFPKYYPNGISNFSFTLHENTPSFEDMKKYDVIVVGNSGSGRPMNHNVFGDDLARILEETKTGVISLMWQNDISGEFTCNIGGKWKSGKYAPLINKGYVYHRIQGLKVVEKVMEFPKVTSGSNAYSLITKLNRAPERKSRIIAYWDYQNSPKDDIVAIAELCDFKHVQLNCCPNTQSYEILNGIENLIMNCVDYVNGREKMGELELMDLKERIEFLGDDESEFLVGRFSIKLKPTDENINTFLSFFV